MITDTDRDDEPMLDDDDPMYPEYWYVVDGAPKRNTFFELPVREYKRRTGAKEVRRCAAVERGLPLW